jgi:hypothetical protein
MGMRGQLLLQPSSTSQVGKEAVSFICFSSDADNGANGTNFWDPDFVVSSHFCSQFIFKQKVSKIHHG